MLLRISGCLVVLCLLFGQVSDTSGDLNTQKTGEHCLGSGELKLKRDRVVKTAILSVEYLHQDCTDTSFRLTIVMDVQKSRVQGRKQNVCRKLYEEKYMCEMSDCRCRSACRGACKTPCTCTISNCLCKLYQPDTTKCIFLFDCSDELRKRSARRYILNHNGNMNYMICIDPTITSPQKSRGKKTKSPRMRLKYQQLDYHCQTHILDCHVFTQSNEAWSCQENTKIPILRCTCEREPKPKQPRGIKKNSGVYESVARFVETILSDLASSPNLSQYQMFLVPGFPPITDQDGVELFKPCSDKKQFHEAMLDHLFKTCPVKNPGIIETGTFLELEASLSPTKASKKAAKGGKGKRRRKSQKSKKSQAG